jgi:hypothetical protein
MYYGLNMSGEYKGFDLTVFFQGQQVMIFMSVGIFWTHLSSRVWVMDWPS